MLLHTVLLSHSYVTCLYWLLWLLMLMLSCSCECCAACARDTQPVLAVAVFDYASWQPTHWPSWRGRHDGQCVAGLQWAWRTCDRKAVGWASCPAWSYHLTAVFSLGYVHTLVVSCYQWVEVGLVSAKEQWSYVAMKRQIAGGVFYQQSAVRSLGSHVDSVVVNVPVALRYNLFMTAISFNLYTLNLLTLLWFLLSCLVLEPCVNLWWTLRILSCIVFYVMLCLVVVFSSVISSSRQ